MERQKHAFGYFTTYVSLTDSGAIYLSVPLISPCLWLVPCSKVTENPKSTILVDLVPIRRVLPCLLQMQLRPKRIFLVCLLTELSILNLFYMCHDLNNHLTFFIRLFNERE